MSKRMYAVTAGAMSIESNNVPNNTDQSVKEFPFCLHTCTPVIKAKSLYPSRCLFKHNLEFMEKKISPNTGQGYLDGHMSEECLRC